MGWCAPELSRNILAGSIMRRDVVTMMPRERVSRVIEVLHATSHHGFPVIDEINSPSTEEKIPEYGHLKGLILKSQLIILMKKRVFYEDPDCHILVDGSELVQLSDFADEYPTSVFRCTVSIFRHDKCLAKLQLSEEDKNCWLDLTPYMHSSPYRVPLSASLPSIFHLFRGLGLRYVAVVDDENKFYFKSEFLFVICLIRNDFQLRGIITRKDLARFKGRRTFTNYTIWELFVSDFQT
ncbi:unnamed protein product [Brugia timori]|uniref:CBS domain-containing protein n=1 Tax=Brugia timori TaxID=42155 RepID=A0A3P7UKQ2_9BILA|nr:unnamed protein product [Brugia timori]